MVAVVMNHHDPVDLASDFEAAAHPNNNSSALRMAVISTPSSMPMVAAAKALRTLWAPVRAFEFYQILTVMSNGEGSPTGTIL